MKKSKGKSIKKRKKKRKRKRKKKKEKEKIGMKESYLHPTFFRVDLAISLWSL